MQFLGSIDHLVKQAGRGRYPPWVRVSVNATDRQESTCVREMPCRREAFADVVPVHVDGFGTSSAPQPVPPSAIGGYYLLWDDAAPVFWTIAGCHDRFVAVFPTVERLLQFAGAYGLPVGELMRIDGEREFLEGMRSVGLHVAIDPERLQTGMVGFWMHTLATGGGSHR